MQRNYQQRDWYKNLKCCFKRENEWILWSQVQPLNAPKDNNNAGEKRSNSNLKIERVFQSINNRAPRSRQSFTNVQFYMNDIYVVANACLIHHVL